MEPGTYQRKPVRVRAMQVPPFEGSAAGDLELWLGKHFESWLPSEDKLIFRVAKSNNMEVTVSAGDWVIEEMDGTGFYPCEAEVFTKTYELVPEDDKDRT